MLERFSSAVEDGEAKCPGSDLYRLSTWAIIPRKRAVSRLLAGIRPSGLHLPPAKKGLDLTIWCAHMAEFHRKQRNMEICPLLPGIIPRIDMRERLCPTRARIDFN